MLKVLVVTATWATASCESMTHGIVRNLKGPHHLVSQDPLPHKAVVSLSMKQILNDGPQFMKALETDPSVDMMSSVENGLFSAGERVKHAPADAKGVPCATSVVGQAHKMKKKTRSILWEPKGGTTPTDDWIPAPALAQTGNEARHVSTAKTALKGYSASKKEESTQMTPDDEKMDEKKPEAKKDEKKPEAKPAAEAATPALKIDKDRLPYANLAADTGKCPEEAVQESPDKFGNCECKPTFRCFDYRVQADAVSFAKELSEKHEKEVIELVNNERKGRSPGCPMHSEADPEDAVANDADGALSQQFFFHSCSWCKCKKMEAKSGAISIHSRGMGGLLVILLVLESVLLSGAASQL